MKLQLRYNEHLHALVKAAFIRGTDPIAWMKEIDHWGLAEEAMDFYLIPSSIQTPDAAGLFVIFKNVDKAKNINLLEPFTCIGEKLFIPCNAELFPTVTETELKNLLLWKLQVFHPATGVIGFEEKDKVVFSDLFIYKQPKEADWSFAHPGIKNKPVFSAINVLCPTAEELIEEVKKEIGQKALQDIPKKDEDKVSPIEKVIDKIKWGLFKSIAGILNAGAKLLPENYSPNNSGDTGILQKFQQWLMKNLDDLEAKRKDEINRLLNLFDENTNEALQYAIPLDSPYFNRGSQQLSGKLIRNPLNFNLGRLGGGRNVDSWDLGDRYNDLRTKYLRAAQKEIEQKDFKKAAYVYAHLLGDYTSAANTLEQGNMYREAASLYKDHLKNLPAAADCLERGGLYLEAIDINKELNKDEKVGDLYKIVQQEKNAELYFEKHIDAKLSHNDYLDAARVIDEKLEQKDRAKDTLLQGWDHSYQHENCLKKYFDIVKETEPENIEQKVKQVFSYAGKIKRIPFLNVLEQVNKKETGDSLAETSREIAYKIVHDEAADGNIQILHRIKTFLPDDKLIASDTSRYTSSNHNKSVRTTTPKNFHLDQTIKWVKAAWHRNQFLIIGLKNSSLHMARVNWYGNIEYYSWTHNLKSHTRFTFINAPYYSNYVLLHLSDGLPVTRKNLPKNKYFTDAITVYCPVWLHKGTAQCVINEQKNIAKIDIGNNNMTLHHYTIEGELKKSVNCFFENSGPSLSSHFSNPLLFHHNDMYYTYKEKYFISVAESGSAKALDLNTIIRFITASSSLTLFRLIISTNSGCLLFTPSNENPSFPDNYFAKELIPTSISFVSADKFIIVEKTTAFLFEIINEEPVMTEEYEAHTLIVGAIPAGDRNQFALIEESGKISIYDIKI